MGCDEPQAPQIRLGGRGRYTTSEVRLFVVDALGIQVGIVVWVLVVSCQVLDTREVLLLLDRCKVLMSLYM